MRQDGRYLNMFCRKLLYYRLNLEGILLPAGEVRKGNRLLPNVASQVVRANPKVTMEVWLRFSDIVIPIARPGLQYLQILNHSCDLILRKV